MRPIGSATDTRVDGDFCYFVTKEKLSSTHSLYQKIFAFYSESKRGGHRITKKDYIGMMGIILSHWSDGNNVISLVQ